MAINYTNLWTDIGVFVRTSDLFYDFARSQGASVPNLNAELNAIQARLESQDLQRITEGLEPLFDTYRNTASSQSSHCATRSGFAEPVTQVVNAGLARENCSASCAISTPRAAKQASPLSN